MTLHLWNIAINDPLSGEETGEANPSWYTADGSDTAPVSVYTYVAYNLLFSTELTNWSTDTSQNPYGLNDTVSDVGGDPTIGVGIDMLKTPSALNLYFNVAKNSAEYKALSSAWNQQNLLAVGAVNSAGAGVFNITVDQSEEAFKYFESLKEQSIDSSFYVGVPGDAIELT
jgi:hypothetical protein